MPLTECLMQLWDAKARDELFEVRVMARLYPLLFDFARLGKIIWAPTELHQVSIHSAPR